MHKSIFKHYDIRGIVGDQLILEEMYQLGCAIAYYLSQKNPHLNKIAIGMDMRLHSQNIKYELCRAFMDSGIDVVFVGICPTPALYFSLFDNLLQPVQAGIMITASHNPPEYNGLKICLGKKALWGHDIQEIKELYNNKKTILNPKKAGNSSQINIVQHYISWLCNHFKHIKNIDLPIVIDCANGMAGAVIPDLVKKMGWNADILFSQLDGTFPNHEADPTVQRNMLDIKKKLELGHYAFGVGFDGDADRIGVMTSDGQLIPCDQLLALFAEQVLPMPFIQAVNLSPARSAVGVVFDSKTSQAVIDLLNNLGAQTHMSPAGHSLIKAAMHKTGALLGGELSGHFFFADRYFGYDDAIYAFMRLVQLVYTKQKSLKELLQAFPKKISTPEMRLTCLDEDKSLIIAAISSYFQQEFEQKTGKKPLDIITIDGVRVVMPYGWGIIRASNTQPVLSLRFEADTESGLQQIQQDFAVALAPFFGKVEIDNILAGS